MARNKPKPLHEAIMDELKNIDGLPSCEMCGRLFSLARIAANCPIDDNHDDIADGFRARFKRIYLSAGEWPDWLFDHIYTEKSRVIRQKSKGKNEKRRPRPSSVELRASVTHR